MLPHPSLKLNENFEYYFLDPELDVWYVVKRVTCLELFSLALTIVWGIIALLMPSGLPEKPVLMEGGFLNLLPPLL